MGNKIFLSYASYDSVFKGHFTHPKLFRNIIGLDIEIFDYENSSNFGEIESFLSKTVDASAAFIAFISTHYIKSEFSSLEFWRGVSDHVNGRLVFVPILMDADAYSWWKKQISVGKLRELTPHKGSYAFVNFADGTGQPMKIFDNGQFNDTPAQRIRDLAILIKAELERRPPPKAPIVGAESLLKEELKGLETGHLPPPPEMPNGGAQSLLKEELKGLETGHLPPPPEVPNGGAESLLKEELKGLEARDSSPLESHTIVVLGYPQYAMPPEVRDARNDLIKALVH